MIRAHGRGRPLTTQLRYGLLLFSLAVLLATGGALIQLSANALRERIAAEHLAQSRAAATEIDAYVGDLSHKLSYLARVRGLADQPREVQRNLLEALSRHNDAYQSVALLDERGWVVARAPDGPPLGDLSSMAAFARAYRYQEDYIGPVELNHPGTNPTVTLAVPVRDGADRVAGALVARIDLSFLGYVVAATRVGETGYAYVLDSRSQVIAERGGRREFDTSALPAAIIGVGPNAGDTAPAPYRGLYGDEVLGASAPVISTYWRVVVEQPTTEVYRPLREMLQAMVGALAATMVLAMVLGVLFARRIVTPLERLTSAADRMSHGDMGARVEAPGGGEMGGLAVAFNTMAERLGDLIHEQAARAEAEASQRRFAFLAEASATLGTTLDYEITLGNLARLVVPVLADWCTIDTLDEERRLRRVGAAHRDPAFAPLLDELDACYPVEGFERHPVWQVVLTERPLVLETLDTAARHEYTHDERHRELLDILGTRSALLVPLRSRGRMLGVISFASAQPGHYSEADIAMAEDLAQRAASAVDNALLYNEAQHAIRARDEFLSVASHELKTPLTAALGNAQLLERRARRSGALGERELHSVRVIADQVARLNRLIEALLDIGRIDRGQLMIAPVLLDFGALVRRVMTEFQPTLERHTLSCRLAAEPLPILGDDLRLEQVLQNLLHNAVKYSPNGGEISVVLERKGEWVCITVADQGIGIPAEALPRLFERFYRASNTRSQQLTGLGIGLFVVDEIVTRHGGTIEVTSREGQGSAFHVALPLLPADHAEQPGESHSLVER